MFDFPHIQTWRHEFINDDKPCVLLATTGMLHAGTSLRVFKEWCVDKKNLVVLPGYCVNNTIGGQILAGLFFYVHPCAYYYYYYYLYLQAKSKLLLMVRCIQFIFKLLIYHSVPMLI